MIGILGGGFGLYGYLPAVASFEKNPILLPVRYKKKFSIRSELVRYTDQIYWIDSDEELIKKATTIIVSRRPKDQYEILDRLLAQNQLTHINFEKPFGQNPKQAILMQKKILDSQKYCSVGFIFRYLPWAIALKSAVLNDPNSHQKTWELKWHFMADHYKNKNYNWKHDHEQGGGVLRFYGIHAIALLAEWGYKFVDLTNVFYDQDGVGLSKWEAQFKGPNLPNFKVQIDTCSPQNLFILKNNILEVPLFQSIGPFSTQLEKITPSLIDPRCNYLTQGLLENKSQAEVWPNRFIDAVSLWSEVEDSTSILKFI
jgi:hypothetical protein